MVVDRLFDPGGFIRSGFPPLITIRDVTKMAAVTHSVTGFPFELNDIRSVTAFTPIFCGVVITVVVISVVFNQCL